MFNQKIRPPKYNEDSNLKELPKYKSHKEVWALKISKIVLDRDIARLRGRETDGSAYLNFEEDKYDTIKVPFTYVDKHDPKAGGYYVVYEDGYKSWSPAEAFENGYSKMERASTRSTMERLASNKTLVNTDADGAKKNVSDLKVWGNGDTFELISKASSQEEGWMKSTKAMEIEGLGCVVQITTQQGDNVAEAVTYVPGAKIQRETKEDGEVVSRKLVKFDINWINK